MFVVCYVGSGLCDRLIARSKESDHVCVGVCVCVYVSNCDLGTSKRDGLGPICFCSTVKK